jgi:ankyrin repeat protein
MYGHTAAARHLIEHGADVNRRGAYRRTALIYAAIGGFLELVRLVLKAGADPQSKNAAGENALFELITAENDDPQLARALIEGGIDPAARDKGHGSALSWAAFCGRQAIVELLLDLGISPNSGDLDGEPALVQAMHQGHPKIVRLLFDRGADPDAENLYGTTLLAHAAERGDQELVKAVLARRSKTRAHAAEVLAAESIDAKATPSTTRKRKSKRRAATDTRKRKRKRGAAAEKSSKSSSEPVGEALAAAATKGKLAIIKLLLADGIPVDSRTAWGSETALIKAARYGKNGVVRYLLSRGADLEAEDSRGNTTLLHAAHDGQARTLGLLLALGADLEHVNRLNWTALMQACVEGKLDAARVLLEAGAKTDTIDDEKGATALTLARHSSNSQLVALLESRGATDRPIRERDPHDAEFSILDCDICAYLPHADELGRTWEPEQTSGLLLVQSQVEQSDRYTTTTDILKRCRICETYYRHYHLLDDEDAFIAGPHVYQHIRRLLPLETPAVLTQFGESTAAAAYRRGYPVMIASLRRRFSSRPSCRAKVLPFVIEALTDHFVAVGDFASLTRVVLGDSAPAQVLSSIGQLFAACRAKPNGAPSPTARWFSPELTSGALSIWKQHVEELRNRVEALVTIDLTPALNKQREWLLSEASKLI